jgi:chemotaxis protein CheD
MPTDKSTAITPVTHSVGMGHVVVVSEGEFACAVLGSCIGLALFDIRSRRAAMAHIILNDSRGAESTLPGKFVDTAIPHMLNLLRREGSGKERLQAKIAGGSNMFGSAGPIQVGKKNYSAVVDFLRELQIPIVAEHVGGDKGRRVSFDPVTARMQVDAAGKPLAVI